MHEQTANPLHNLAALPELVEQKDTLPMVSQTSIGSVIGAVGQAGPTDSQSGLILLNLNQATTPSRQSKDSTAQPSVVPLSVASNCVTSSAGFLKHSVDSITSSLYGPMTSGGTFSMATSPVSSSAVGSYHGNMFGVDSGAVPQFTFSLGNTFSSPKSSYQGSAMGAGFV